MGGAVQRQETKQDRTLVEVPPGSSMRSVLMHVSLERKYSIASGESGKRTGVVLCCDDWLLWPLRCWLRWKCRLEDRSDNCDF